MTIDGGVLAGVLVLAAEAGGGGRGTGLLLLVVGLAVTVAGLAILTARGRSDEASSPPAPASEVPPEAAPAPSPPAATTTTAPPVLPPEAPPVAAPAPEPAPEPVLDVAPAPAPEPAPPPEPAPVATPAPAPVPTTAEPDPAPRPAGPCDWELHLDLHDEDEPLVVRAATAGRACCVHVLRLRCLDAPPTPLDREDRSWSGDRTRIGPSRAVSDVRADTHRLRPEVDGLDLDLDASLHRAAHPAVVTTWEDVPHDPAVAAAAERLWSTHLARLRDEELASDPDDAPARLQAATLQRHRVELAVTRTCDAGHRLEVEAEPRVRVLGEMEPVSGSRLTVSTAAAWVAGDLEVAALDPVDVSPDTEHAPAAGGRGVPGVAMVAASGYGEVRGTFGGTGRLVREDDGLALVVGTAAVVDLGLGEGPSPAVGRATVGVEASHRLAVAVAARTPAAEGDDRDAAPLRCACAPTWGVRFGGPSDDDGRVTTPDATLVVEGHRLHLDRVVDARHGALPRWVVRDDPAPDTDLPRTAG